MFRRFTLMVVLVALAAGACGDDDSQGSAEEQAVASALTAQIQTDSDSGEPFDDAASSQCLADGLVAELGLARLEELGVTSESVTSQEAFFSTMTDAEIEAAVEVSFSCADFEAVFAAEFVDSMSAESAACLAGRLMDSGFLAEATAAELQGETFDPSADPVAMGQITTAAEACLSDAELVDFFGG